MMTTFPEMTRGVLAHLLDLVGEPAALSPRALMGAPAALSAHTLAQLYAAGIFEGPIDANDSLTPEFRRAARVLLHPATHLTIRAWGGHPACTETSFVFPGLVTKGGGVVFSMTDEFCRVSGFANHHTVMGTVAGVLPSPIPGVVPSFEALLDVAAAAALCGLIDLEHRSPAVAVSADDIAAYVGRNWNTAGFGDLTSLLVPLCQAADPPAVSELADGLSWLLANRLVTRDREGGYHLEPALAPIVTATASIEGGLQWQRVTADVDGEATVNHRVFLVGASAVVLALTQTTQHRVHLVTATRADVVTFVATELAALS